MAVFLPHKKILPSAFSFNKKIPINKCEFENNIKDTIFKIGNVHSPHQVAGIISFLLFFADKMKKIQLRIWPTLLRARDSELN